MRDPKRAIEFILGALGASAAEPPPFACDDIVDAASLHGVALVLETRVSPSSALGMALRERNGNHRHRALATVHQLRSLLDIFSARGIEAIPIKGPVLSALVYGDPAARGVGADLDLVLRERDLPRAIEAVTQNGYIRTMHDLDEHHHDELRSEASLWSSFGGIGVELHTRLIGSRDTAAMSLENVFARASKTLLFGTSMLTPEPEDLLLYLCLHGASHTWSRILWLYDVAALVQRYPELDWEKLFARAASISAQRRLGFALGLAAGFFGASVPHELCVRSPLRRRIVLARMEEIARGKMRSGLALRTVSQLVERESLAQWRGFVINNLAPNARDRAWVRLPKRLEWLRWMLRPLRLVTSYGTGIRKRP
jgi:hypothetical protein